MTNAELISKIKAEIERQMDEYKPIVGGVDELTGAHIVLAKLLSFLDTLEESERPEPYNPVYDEAYLNEKIKKATESWKGADVDAMLAECRGYDEEKSEIPNDIEEAAKEYTDGKSWAKENYLTPYIREAFIAGSEWRYQKDRAEFAKLKAKTWCEGFDACKEQMEERWLKDRDGCFWDGVEEGKKAMREQMLKEARNHFVYNILSGNDMKKMIELYNDEVSCKPGDVVRIIIVKEDEK